MQGNHILHNKHYSLLWHCIKGDKQWPFVAGQFDDALQWLMFMEQIREHSIWQVSPNAYVRDTESCKYSLWLSYHRLNEKWIQLLQLFIRQDRKLALHLHPDGLITAVSSHLNVSKGLSVSVCVLVQVSQLFIYCSLFNFPSAFTTTLMVQSHGPPDPQLGHQHQWQLVGHNLIVEKMEFGLVM